MLETTPNYTLTIELPEPVFRQLAQVAASTHQSLEGLATQSIVGNLPPSVENAPTELQEDLLKMQILSIPDLLEIAHTQIPLSQQEYHQQLLEKNSAGTLTPAERQVLCELRLAADRLMVRKAYAWSLLRWRGQRVPALHELPLA